MEGNLLVHRWVPYGEGGGITRIEVERAERNLASRLVDIGLEVNPGPLIAEWGDMQAKLIWVVKQRPEAV